MNFTFYNTTVANPTPIGLINYVDMTTSYLFLPTLLLLTFILSFLMNRDRPINGLIFASSVTSLMAMLFYFAFGTLFNLTYLFIPLIVLGIGVFFKIFER